MTKFVFVTGGVVSSLGKGIAAASLAAILESRGLKVTLIKLDPYINVDPGTMSPFQHGEVFVTDDGAETDLDLSHYERFITIHENSDLLAKFISVRAAEKQTREDNAFGFSWFFKASMKYWHVLRECILASIFVQIFDLWPPDAVPVPRAGTARSPSRPPESSAAPNSGAATTRAD